MQVIKEEVTKDGFLLRTIQLDKPIAFIKMDFVVPVDCRQGGSHSFGACGECVHCGSHRDPWTSR